VRQLGTHLSDSTDGDRLLRSLVMVSPTAGAPRSFEGFQKS
jgi:hypothetical protein